MKLKANEVHALKKAPPVEGVLPAIHGRWSARSFAERAVSPEALRGVFEAARWAASSNNEQPWRFVMGRRGSLTWQKLYEALAGFNSSWAQKAPVLILGVAHTRFSRNGAQNAFALFDLGAATANLTLQAAELGLTTRQMAGYDREALRHALEISADYELGTVIALGYQGEPEALGDPMLIQRETESRTRKPLGEIVFSAWGVAAEI